LSAYTIGGWKDFFAAVSGAAAALAGLLFVALSINLTRIINRGIVDRAAETLILLSSVLTVGLLGLIPQSPTAFGCELLAAASLTWGVGTYLHAKALRFRLYDTTFHVFLRVTFAQSATLPLLIGAVTLLLRRGGGLYWLAAGLILPLLVSMINAWILLVEIMR
jgi:modulator of FtsH protease